MNVGYLIERSARQFAEKTSVIDIPQKVTLTFREINQRTNRLANALIGLGLKKGNRVAILMKNQFQFLETEFALAKAGLVKVALNARENMAEHFYKINDSGTLAVIVGQEFADQLLSCRQEIPGVKFFIAIGNGAGRLAYEELIQAGASGTPEISVSESDLYMIRYTSGTTGFPKGVCHDHEGFVAGILSAQIAFHPKLSDVLLHQTPLSHAAGHWVCPYFISGATSVIQQKFEDELFLKTVQEHKITTAFMVPTMITLCLENSNIGSYDLSTLQTVIYGSAPIAKSKLEQALHVFGPVFLQVYGLTEFAPIITCLPKEDHVVYGSPDELLKLKSAGSVVPQVELVIKDNEGREAGIGTPGEVVVRGPVAMREYWNLPEATAETMVNGWINTNDVGYLDEQGYLYLVDRKSDVIISGGFNIYPREVEDVIYKHPAVLKACVFGVPDEKWGEAVKAVVVLKEGLEISDLEIISYCKTQIASYKVPKSLEFSHNLPESATGKIIRREIKHMYWHGTERKIN